MKRFFAILAVLMILIPSAGLAAPVIAAPGALAPVPLPAAQGQVPRFEPGPCSFPGTPMIGQNLDLQCGTLTVPEIHGSQNGKSIQLAVAIIKSRAANPDPVPLVLLQGGPGGSTIYTYLTLIPLDPRLMNLNRDIVLFDQRGTKYSQPSLFCDEVYQLGIDLLNVDLSNEESDRRYEEAVVNCHRRLVDEGVNLSAYNSLENAADVNDLRQALGYQKIHLYGVSYGTLLAQHVLRMFPEMLASVTIDSVVAPQINSISDQPRVLNRGLDALFQGCAEDAACSRAYPDLRNVFYQQIDRLNDENARIEVKDYKSGKTYPALLDGDSLLYSVIQMLYSTDLIPLIPRAIYQVRAGDYRVMETILSNTVFDDSINWGMYYSVFCAEETDFDPSQVNLQGLPPQLAEDEGDSPQQFLQTCQTWDVQPLPASAGEPVQSSVPVLVLSGEYDPVTPAEYAAKAAVDLTNNYQFVFPKGGHGALTSGACQDGIFLQFLNNPNQKPDGSCINEMHPSFNTPGALVPMPGVLNLFSPQGMNLVMLVLYGLGALFLLTALLVYPIVWLVRVLNKPSRPAAVASPYAAGEVVDPYAAPAASRTKPLLYKLGPWLAVFTGIFLTAFIIILYVVALQMALANDNRVLFGLPGSARPLFLLPLLAAIFSLLMLLGAVTAWARRSGSVWGRIYLSLLTIAAIACVAALAYFGAVQALFMG